MTGELEISHEDRNEFSRVLLIVDTTYSLHMQCYIINKLIESEKCLAVKELLIKGRDLLIDVILARCSKYYLDNLVDGDNPKVIKEWVERSNNLSKLSTKWDRFWKTMLTVYR